MSLVSIEFHGVIAVITINNPPVNALSQQVREGIYNAIISADKNFECVAIIIICKGKTFIAGADIKEFDFQPQEPYLPDVVARIENCKKPVIAAIHGTTLGGGLEIALGCHYRISDSDTKLGFPEVNIGLLPGASGTQRLPRLVGVLEALEMMLSGEFVNTSKALEIGLIDKVTNTNLLSEAISFAEECQTQEIRRIRDMNFQAFDSSVFDVARKKILLKERGLISPGKIIDAVELATKVSFDAGCSAERDLFLECMNSSQSAGLRHAFFAERKVGKISNIERKIRQRSINKIGIIGAGTMGVGIAYACLTSGLEVVLLDNDSQALDHGKQNILSLFARGVERTKISEVDMKEALKCFITSQNYHTLENCDLVIEAVYESMSIKKEVFSILDSVLQQGAILATNTSTLSIDEIAKSTSRPRDVIGLHFFSPAHIMRLLEIIRGEETASDVIATVLTFAKKLKKIGVVVGNCYGFVGNRMLHAYGRENQLLLLEGAAPEYIDKTLYDWGMAMGPNAVSDLAGLDVGYKARREHDNFQKDPRFYRIADILVQMGRYGQKTGKGMYIYEEGSRQPKVDFEISNIIKSEAEKLGVKQRNIGASEIIERCIYALVLEGVKIIEEGIVSRSSDIDTIWLNGYGFPRYRGGPMYYADTIGLEKILAAILNLENKFGSKYWHPPKLLCELVDKKKKFQDLLF